EHWHLLLSELDQDTTENKDFLVFLGFIDGVDRINEPLAHEFLNQCAVHPSLSRVLVKIHPQRDFTETDLNRCMSLLDKPDICPFMFDTFLWDKKCRQLPAFRVLELAERLLALENGEEAILNGLGMRLHGKKTPEDMPGPEFLHIGLRAAIQVLQRETDLRGSLVDIFMETVVAAALQSDDQDGLKHQWLDTVFSAIDRHYGYMHDYRKTIQTTVELIPEALLSRLFTGSEDQRVMRLFFMRGSLGDTPLL
ncbi:hypothetical protein NVR66_22925, partial [Enterobacter bugandensis]|nr:hypothetical protein [Enterobacter bugandensis]